MEFNLPISKVISVNFFFCEIIHTIEAIQLNHIIYLHNVMIERILGILDYLFILLFIFIFIFLFCSNVKREMVIKKGAQYTRRALDCKKKRFTFIV